MSHFKPEHIVSAVHCLMNGLGTFTSMIGPVDVDRGVYPLDNFSTTPDHSLYYFPRDGTRLMMPPLPCAALQGLNTVIYSLFGFLKQKDQLQGNELQGNELQNNLDDALFLALFSGYRKTADLLLDLGANPGRKLSSNGLHGAASRGLKKEIHRYIKEFGVEVDVQDQKFETAVMYAMQLDEPRDWETIELLFRLGALPDVKVEVGGRSWTYAQYAWAMGKEDLAKRLEEAADASPTCYALSRESSLTIGQD